MTNDWPATRRNKAIIMAESHRKPMWRNGIIAALKYVA